MRQQVLLLLALAAFAIAADDDLVVKVKNGELKGKYMNSRSGREFRAFLGIPYAEAPVRELRFQPPTPAQHWNGIRDATNTSICVQIDIYVGNGDVEGVEDCLVLNVYTPKVNSKDLLPVMVWLHPGGFIFGSGHPDLYDPVFLMDKDIVLVSINFRLGALGFLTTGDDVVPGNMGLKDQVLALKWVQENIASFNGDPNSVTIFGDSAGGACTHYLMLTPLTKGLFHAVITQSGTSFCDWAIQTKEDGVKAAHKLAEFVDCPTDARRKMLECLKDKPAVDLVNANKKFVEWAGDPYMIFRPVVESATEGSFLPDHPWNLAKSGNAMDVPWIVGVVSHESSYKIAGYLDKPNVLTELKDNLDKYFPISCSFSDALLENVMSNLKTLYFGSDQDDFSFDNLVNMYSDAMRVACSIRAIDASRQTRSQPIYLYLFSYRGSKSFLDLTNSSNYQGVAHGDDVFYLFPGNMFVDKSLNETDTKMSEELIEMWTNFAKNRNPNLSSDQTKWKPISSEKNEYLNIKGPGNMEMEENMFKERMDFWRKLKMKTPKYQYYINEL